MEPMVKKRKTVNMGMDREKMYDNRKETKNIYIMISCTNTKFAYCIRKLGRVQYNHAAISLDSDFDQLYAFARPQHNAIFLGKLEKESLKRYTLETEKPVPVVVFRIALSKETYHQVKSRVEQIYNDPEYMYNLFSVLSYPLTRGFETYKAFTCMEFVAYILKSAGLPLEKPNHRYKPDDLLSILSEEIVYEGDIRGCMPVSDRDHGYFNSLTKEITFKSIKAVFELARRLFSRNYYTA